MRNDTDYAPGSGPSDPEHGDPNATEHEPTEHQPTGYEPTEQEAAGYPPTDPELANADEADATAPDDERLYPDADRTDTETDTDAPTGIDEDAARADAEWDDSPRADTAQDEEPYLATGDAAEDSTYPVADDRSDDRADDLAGDRSDELDDRAEEPLEPAGRAGLDDGDTVDRADAYDEALDDEPVAGTDGQFADGAALPAADDKHPVVDNFVDETSGADPYAPPEPADTSGPVGVASIPAQDGTAESERAEAEAQTAEAMALAGAAAGVGYVAGTRASAADPEPAADEREQLPGTAAELEPADAAAPGRSERDELMPGEAELAPMAVVIAAEDADRMRQRWQQLQLRFIDDPSGTADEAQRLVGEVVQILSAALASQRDALEDWRSAASGDTEIFRAAVMRYRDFFDRLLSL
jgi:hypothetical protein